MIIISKERTEGGLNKRTIFMSSYLTISFPICRTIEARQIKCFPWASAWSFWFVFHWIFPRPPSLCAAYGR